MSAISTEIPEAMSSTVAADQMVRTMVEARRDLGLARAIDAVARECRLKPRRIRAFWARELHDWWASEDRAIRDAYGDWIEQHRKRMDAEQALLDAQLDALREGL